MSKPPTVVELIWERDLVFNAKSGDVALTIDSAAVAGASPMQLVGFGLAGCMAMDVVHILKKGRHELRGLRANLTGRRADEDPRRFIDITLHYTIDGSVPSEAVDRAIQLSREKYCSVWHSLRQDILFTVTYSVGPLT